MIQLHVPLPPFDHMAYLLINNFIKDEDKPIGDVQDSFLQG